MKLPIDTAPEARYDSRDERTLEVWSGSRFAPTARALVRVTDDGRGGIKIDVMPRDGNVTVTGGTK